MREKIENSKEFRDRILKDEKLLNNLSEKISDILEGKVEIGEDESYTFVPLVYEKPVFVPELFAGPVVGILPHEHIGPLQGIIVPWRWWWQGIPSPEILHYLEKYRVTEQIPRRAMSLGEQILNNKELLGELSEGISGVLKEHGVAISEDAVYMFSPIVYKKPTFAHEMFMDVGLSAFSPAVLADPTPEPSIEAMAELRASEPHLIIKRIVGPIDGIPAPELLHALERFNFRIRGIRG